MCFDNGRKHYGKRRKCWLPAFSPFPTMFSKGFFFKVVRSWDCVVKSQTVKEAITKSDFNFDITCMKFFQNRHNRFKVNLSIFHTNIVNYSDFIRSRSDVQSMQTDSLSNFPALPRHSCKYQ